MLYSVFKDKSIRYLTQNIVMKINDTTVTYLKNHTKS